MRFFTITTKELGYIELVDVEGTYSVALTSKDQVVAAIPLDPSFNAGAKQLGLHHIRKGIWNLTPEGPTFSVAKEPTGWYRRPPDVAAIVLVRTPPGSEGVRLTQASYDEFVEHGYVRRNYHDFDAGGEPPPGISVIATNEVEGAGLPERPQWLLSLLPNASFRIERLGRMEHGIGTISVRWNGRELMVKPYGRDLAQYASRLTA